MQTAILSDLHLGATSRADLLRRRAIRDRLLPALAGADRIVLLGDVLELRDKPLADVLAAARPFFEDLREAAPDAELVIVPGNHDYQLLEPWLQRRRLRATRDPVGVEQRISPRGDAVGKIAGWAGRARTVIAYPGLHLRSDVYATHGHYLDSHLTMPTLERLSVGAIQRFTRGSSDGPSSPEEYERAQAPLYALLFALAQRPGVGGGRPGSKTPSVRVWETLGGASGKARTIRGRVLGSTVVPGAIKLAGKLGLGKYGTDLSVAEIGRAGARAMGEVVERLEIEAAHVLFGHTHRRGPLNAAESAPESDWSRGASRLYNCGSWVYAPTLIGSGAAASPFWPGTVIVLDDSGAPQVNELLGGMTESEIRDVVREPD